MLAGVVISFTLGEEGIFRRAEDASKLYENAQRNEEESLKEVSNYIGNFLNGNKKDEGNEEETVTNVKEAIEKGTIYDLIQQYMMNIIIQ
jgi:hypothetical protein